MATTKHESVENLQLDLHNYRTVGQSDEKHAVNALIAIKPDWFWALMESLLDDGYSPTENIIVLKSTSGLVVKEGNRRVASLKIILGLVSGIEVPDSIQQRINALPSDWHKDNTKVPCAIYSSKEKAQVDKLVSRTHAKGESAGRAPWSSVARARFGRDELKKSELGLDLLEEYIADGKNRSPQQAERWAGDYPLTVLNEAIQRLGPILGCKSASEVVKLYPKKYRKEFEQILHDIGTDHLGFKELRSAAVFWGAAYGFTPPSTHDSGAPNSGTSSTTTDASQPATAPAAGAAGGVPPQTKAPSAKTYASNDPKSVRKVLRGFVVRGKGRDKIATLVEEIRRLKHEEFPHAFCFLLRSIFELSAKAYCADHKKKGGPSSQDKNGQDRRLVDVLRDITNHLTVSKSDRAMMKKLHGPMTELAKSDGVLSVTSLNQLVHHSSFSVSGADISIMFGNVFPLLEAMNG